MTPMALISETRVVCACLVVGAMLTVYGTIIIIISITVEYFVCSFHVASAFSVI